VKPVLGIRGVMLLSVLGHSAFAGGRVNLALFGLKLSDSALIVGLLLSLLALIPAFISVRGGRWADRVGARPVVIAGTGLLALGSIVAFVFPVLYVLFVAAILIGLGFNFLHLAIQKLGGQLSEQPQADGSVLSGDALRERSKKNFSVIALGFSISGFLGPLIAGFSIDYLGYKTTFGLLAIGPLLGLLLAWRYLFDAPKPLVQRDENANAFDLMKIPELRRLYVAVAALTSAWDVHQFLVPLYGTYKGLSASTIGLILGSFAAATFVVRFALPFVVHKFSEWSAITFALVVSTMAYFLYPFLPAVPLMFTVSFVLGIGLGVAQPMVLSLLHHSAPAGRVGEAVGVRLTLVNGSQAVLPTLFGAAGAAFGIAPVFWVMSALAGGGSLMALKRTLSKKSE
jgi:MFS family permease